MVTRGYNRLLLKHTDSFIGNGSVLSKPVQTQTRPQRHIPADSWEFSGICPGSWLIELRDLCCTEEKVTGIMLFTIFLHEIRCFVSQSLLRRNVLLQE